jgi:hypothetical protein
MTRQAAFTLRSILHLALADFRERTRRYSFLVTLGVIVYLGYLVNSGQLNLRMGIYRGVYNSAWLGTEMTLVITFFLGLFGFYLVKNTVERDIQTGVGQIIATTPIHRFTYLIGKWLSDFMLLGTMAVLLAAAGILMQLLQHEAALDLWAFLAPLLVVALPALALVSGVAVLFEAVSWLRGSFGNLVYFCLWMWVTVMIIETPPGQGLVPDPLGLSIFMPSITHAVQQQLPDFIGGFSLSISSGLVLIPFSWNGIPWTAGIVLPQLMWVGVGMVLVGAGAIFFHRFDPALERPRKEKKPRKTPAFALAVRRLLPRLNFLNHFQPSGRFLVTLLAEMRILLRGRAWWWYAVAAGLVALAAAVNPAPIVRVGLLPAAWLWPVVIWSGMGSREKRFRVHQLVFSAARPLSRQLPAAWLAGVGVTALTGSGAALAYLFNGDAAGLAAWAAAVVFIPSLALALGIWSESSRLFEVVFFVWWYLGPLNHQSGLDFIGMTSARTISIYFALAAILFATAVLGRKRQLQN